MDNFTHRVYPDKIMSSQLPQNIRTTLKASQVDNVAFSLMVGMGETYVAAFVLALGMSGVSAGLFSVIPLLTGATLQIISPYVVKELKSYKKWVLICASLQAASFVPLILLALTEHSHSLVIFGSLSLYWAGGLGGGAAWNTWMGQVVPAKVRTSFFARRSRWGHLAVLSGLLLGALVLEQGRIHQNLMMAFVALFSVSLIFRLVSVISQTYQVEPLHIVEKYEVVNPIKVFKSLYLNKDSQLLRFLIVFYTVVHISGPFYAPYMLQILEMNYETYMTLIASSFLAKSLSLYALSRFTQKVTPSGLLKISALFVIFPPVFWVFTQDVYVLTLTQLFSGAGWGVFELAVMLSFFEKLPANQRTSILAVYNFFYALAMTTGGLIGGKLLTWLGEDTAAYHMVFITSSGLRLAALGLLTGFKTSWIRMPKLALKPLAVRPTSGSVAPPVVPLGSNTPEKHRSEKHRSDKKK